MKLLKATSFGMMWNDIIGKGTIVVATFIPKANFSLEEQWKNAVGKTGRFRAHRRFDEGLFEGQWAMTILTRDDFDAPEDYYFGPFFKDEWVPIRDLEILYEEI